MSELDEEWRTVPSFPAYEISSLGRLRKYIPATCVYRNGYRVVGITEGKKIPIHALVAEAFLGPRPRGRVIDHIDGDKLNNRPANLEYVTQSENASRWGRMRAARGGYGVGENATRTSLKDKQRWEVVRRFQGGQSYREIAKRMTVTRGAVHHTLYCYRHQLGIFKSKGAKHIG